MFYFIRVQILVYLRHGNGDVKLKFNKFIASVEHLNTTDAGLSYDFCVVLKQIYLCLKFFKTTFCLFEVILEESLIRESYLSRKVGPGTEL